MHLRLVCRKKQKNTTLLITINVGRKAILNDVPIGAGSAGMTTKTNVVCLYSPLKYDIYIPALSHTTMHSVISQHGNIKTNIKEMGLV